MNARVQSNADVVKLRNVKPVPTIETSVLYRPSQKNAAGRKPSGIFICSGSLLSPARAD